MSEYLKKPEWLNVRYSAEASEQMASLMRDMKLNTVCSEAMCPNLGECFKNHTATFIALGKVCTRNCTFCNIASGKPDAPDPEEPERIAEAAKALSLRHIVVTQVTRDDLPDGGAGHMAEIARMIRKYCPGSTVELLISDLGRKKENLDIVLSEAPDVLNHNIEMPRELYGKIRKGADYDASLGILEHTKRTHPEIKTKTGFMLGLGESEEMIDRLLDDISSAKCDILTIGQYLRPSEKHAPLYRYVTPEEFEGYREKALKKGIKYVVSTPLVRSSYRALEALEGSVEK